MHQDRGNPVHERPIEGVPDTVKGHIDWIRKVVAVDDFEDVDLEYAGYEWDQKWERRQAREERAQRRSTGRAGNDDTIFQIGRSKVSWPMWIFILFFALWASCMACYLLGMQL
jgi:hypothetical protein